MNTLARAAQHIRSRGEIALPLSVSLHWKGAAGGRACSKVRLLCLWGQERGSVGARDRSRIRNSSLPGYPDSLGLRIYRGLDTSSVSCPAVRSLFLVYVVDTENFVLKEYIDVEVGLPVALTEL